MTSIAFTLLASFLVLGAPEVYLSPFDAPMVPGENSGTRHVALEAAANEQEAFYLRVVNDETTRVVQSIDMDWIGRIDPVSTIYRLEKDSEALALVTDPIPLEPSAILNLLVSVRFPSSTKAGVYSGELRINFDIGKAERGSVRMEVFDFALPEESSLPVLFGLDRAAIKNAAGLTEALDDWATFYDALASLRAGYAVWPQRYPTNEMFYDYRDLDLLKEHLAYAVRTANLPAIEIGGRPGDLLTGWPPPVGNAPQDPLQLLLFNITTSQLQLGWTKPTVLIPSPLPDRDGWPGVRQALARVGRADNVVARLLPGPLTPYFERYTDIWALPGTTPPGAMSLLERGLSTVRFEHPPYSRIDGSPGILDETGTYATEPGDAFDGCEYTAWRIATDGSAGGGVLEVEFDPPRRIEQLAIVWPYGAAPSEIKVETALNPDSYSDATVRWSQSNFLTEGEDGISLGAFKYPRDCRSVRLNFFDAKAKRVGVAEVLFNQDGRTVVNASIEPVAPWLNLRTEESPWLDAKVEASAWRMLPWFCWQRHFQGILGPELTPEPAAGATRLIAASPSGVFPSVALIHLLDGLEDYEYLLQYWKAVSDKSIVPPPNMRPGWVALPPSVRAGEQVQTSLSRLHEQRLSIGRLLSGQGLVTKNFGP